MNHNAIVENWKKLISKDYKEYLTFFSVLNKTKDKPDIKSLNEEAFERINCLACAHCCKTTPALLNSSDISRISSHLGISKKEFSKKYVLEDVNGELSFNKVPCHFLLHDNSCSIYEIRPEACRKFPHTDDNSYFKRPVLNAKNVMVCPAAYFIAEKCKEILDH